MPVDDLRQKNFDLIDKTLSILQEFYIEFFGIFLPGFVAVGLMCVYALACFTFCLYPSGVREALWMVWTFSTGCSAMTALFGLFVAYMVGAIVYRREPKKPDSVASLRQWQNTHKSEEKGRLAVQFGHDFPAFHSFREYVLSKINPAAWIRESANRDIDYPYPCLRKFLMARHLDHLADYVSWCESHAGRVPKGGGAAAEDLGREGCSKHIINTIKHCVRVSGCANLISDMMRNE